MPDVRHFGLSARVPLRQPGAKGLAAAMIHLGRAAQLQLGAAAARQRFGPDVLMLDHAATVVALHFEPGGAMDEHSADHDILFIVTLGSGLVRVGGPAHLTVSVEAGDAVAWPASELHVAWAGHDGMDAISVEFTPAR